MNVNITGIYDNTVIVDNNLFEDVLLLQMGLGCGWIDSCASIVGQVWSR